MQNFKHLIFGLLLIISYTSFSQTKLETPNVESILYLGNGKNQPLIVGLGGSEGGNAWTSNYWKKTRDQFIEKGYAFLAIGYFGLKGTPDTLQKIAIEEVYFAIKLAGKNKKINNRKIVIIGGSRGADLALLLGSYALTSERIANAQLSVFVAVPAASGASLAQMDPRQDEQWVELHKPDYPEQTADTTDEPKPTRGQ